METYSTVLFCTDFSSNADAAFTFAIRATLKNPGATLHIFHVIPETAAQFWKGYITEVGDMDSKAKADIDAKLSEYCARLPPDVSVTATVRMGDASRSILDYASEIHADLIVVGRQGNGALAQWLVGNVTSKIAKKATCPVLIVPQ